MPDPTIQGVPEGEEQEAQVPAPGGQLVAPAGFFTEDTDEAQVERLEAWRAAEQENKRKAGRSFARKAYEAIAEPMARGTTKAIDATSELVVGLGGAIVKPFVKAGVGTEEYREEFMDWYSNKDRVNPLKFGDEFRDKHLGGPSDTLWEGLLEGGTQFAVGFIGAGKLMAATKLTRSGSSLKTVLGGGRDFGKLLEGITSPSKMAAVKEAMRFSLKELAYETVRGGIADFTVFDGHEERLADLMEEHDFLRNPIQQFLVSDEDDTEFEGRMKNLLEGAMMGATIDGFIGSIRGFRAWKRALGAAQRGEDVLVRGAIDEMVEAIARDDIARQAQIEELREIPDGEIAVTVKNEDGTTSLLVRRELGDVPDEIAVFADSNEIGKVGMENLEAAVIDPITKKVARGTSHEEAVRAIAADRLGMDIESEDVSVLTSLLMGSARREADVMQEMIERLGKEATDEITGEFDGFIERGAPDEDFVTRQATQERLSAELGDHQEMRFDSAEEAEQVGAALEMVERARVQQRGIDATGFDPETAGAWHKEALKLEEAFRSGDKDVIAKATAESSVNLKHIYNSVRAKSALAALAQQYPEVTKRVQFSFAEMKRYAGDLIPEDANEAQMMAAMAEVFGESENLAGNIIWMRAWVISLGNEAQKLAQLVESTPLGAARDIHMTELTKQLDAMLDFQDLLTGTLSNVGRALRSAAIDLGPRKIKAGKGGIAEVKGMVEAAVEEVDKAAQLGKDTRIPDKKLDEALDMLAKIMGETTDEGIAGVRAADVPGPETLPRGAAKEGDEVVTETAKTLTREERMDALMKRADELLGTEAGREAKLRELEGLESATAPPTRRSVADMTPEDIDALTRAVFNSDNGNPAEILQQLLVPASRTVAGDGARFINQPELKGWRKARRALSWYRVNAMLSGPRTHAINTLSNAMTVTLRPLEMAIGGALYGNKEAVRQAADLVVGLGQNWHDHWRAAKKAMKTSQGVLDPKTSHFSGSYAATQEALRGGSGSLLSRIVGTPGKWLMGLDEFASQANYRAHLRAGVLKEGRRMGKAGDELSQWVEAQMRMGYGADGQAINRAARDFARENTFKAELGPAGQSFEQFVNGQHAMGEMMQFLMPFRKTPINITKYAWQRMPGINLLSRNYREALTGAAGKAAKEEALGKLVVGSMMYSSAGYLFLNKQLTGRGPSDPKARKMWLAAGNRPGTLTVGGTTIELRRLDPVLTPFVMAANLMEAAGELDDETYREAATLLTLTMAESVAERSFFTGLTEFLEAATGGNEDLMNRWVENATASLIPNLIKQTNYDNLYREADGFVEEILKNTMFFSTQIEPRRNLFGEPAQKPAGWGQRAINPFTMTWGATVDQKLAQELYDIGSTMTLPAEEKSFGEGGSINLRQRGKYENVKTGNKSQSPYDRWMQLMAGKEVNGDRTLKARIERMSQTQGWAEADPTIKRNMLEKIIAGSRDAAWAQVLIEFPTLREEVIFRRQMGGLKNNIADEGTLQTVRDLYGMTEKGRWERLRDRLK